MAYSTIGHGSERQDHYHNVPATQSLTYIEPVERVFRSELSTNPTPFLAISGTAYFVYVGRTVIAIAPPRISLHCTTAGLGTQIAEIGLFSTPSAPNGASQSLTKLVSTGTVDSLTSTGRKRNTSAFATELNVNTYLWAGVRFAMATTQPTVMGLFADISTGCILQLTGAGALTGAGPFTGSVIAVNTAAVCPDLRITLD